MALLELNGIYSGLMVILIGLGKMAQQPSGVIKGGTVPGEIGGFSGKIIQLQSGIPQCPVKTGGKQRAVVGFIMF